MSWESRGCCRLMGVVKLMGAQEPKRCPLDTFGSPSLMYHDPPCCQLHLVEFESIDCTLLRTYRISRMSCVPGKDTDNLEVHQFSKNPTFPLQSYRNCENITFHSL